ncbi:mitochondrial import receptor subunit TOM70-like [Acanthaster planci]|uniref:Mitochondrial import receptor subunit TOM70-like n=1 Tax=Acanthaster planci TaxID=133434 RepID=A0A8B7ZW87_ACAPL|nr:mitochondrial import receptor subunit TOM70-like [Acanthaster planci]
MLEFNMADGGEAADVGSSFPKSWKFALAIGAPIAIGVAVGAFYWHKRRSDSLAGGKGGKTDPKAKSKDTGNEATAATTDERTAEEKAQASKNKGNKYFKAGRYEQAIACYNEAIELVPEDKVKDLSTFYQNRAAAHEQLKNYAQVVADCTKALELNSRYVKALFRRAKSFENMNQKMKCLEDATAVCILENFSHQQSMMLADKMLKELGKEKAQQRYKERVPSLPSGQFIRSYFSSFSNDGISKANDDYNDEGAGDVGMNGYRKAHQLFTSGDYGGVIEACDEEINSSGDRLAEALLMRATFYLLMGQAAEAKPDLDRLIEMTESSETLRANALIKRGSMHMQEGNSSDAMNDFATAVRIDPDNADIYHHRGQLNLLLDRIDDAAQDFEKCNKLNGSFALAHAQYSYAKYRLALVHQSPMQLQTAMQQLENSTKKFPACAEAFALYAQAQSDQGQFATADENFQKAIALEPDNPTAYVHRGLLHLSWKKDAEGAIAMIKKAMEIDSKCDFAYETLGTIEVQRGNMAAAKDYFEKAIDLARTEMEMSHLFSLSVAAEAQQNVTTKYNITPPSPIL